MSEEELIIGFFEKGYCLDLDEVKNVCLGLLKENKELKKQFENTIEELELVRCDLHNRTSERDGLDKQNDLYKNQQQEFIKWLESMSKMYENEYKDIDIAEHYNCVLTKYKEIIGVKDE